MADIIQQSFHINLKIMQILGLYNNNSLLLRIRAYTMYFILLVAVAVLGIVNICTSDTENSFMGAYLGQIFPFCFKLLPFFTKGNRIKKCINYFGHPRFAPKNSEEEKIMKDCIYVCRRNSIVYFYGVLGGLIFWNVPPLIRTEYVLPTDIWLPYEPRSNALLYYSTFLFTILACAYDAYFGSIVDPLMGGLAYHATAQLKILKHNLQNLTQNLKPDETIEQKIKQCVEHHICIIHFINEFEECFSWCLFCQIGGSTLGLCFCLVGLLTAPLGSIAIIQFTLYYQILGFEIFFYCYYGSLLFEENDGLINSIYTSPWYLYDIKTRKNLIFMMVCAQKPVILKAAKTVQLTLVTFSSILKGSYSLFTVLK